MDYWNNIISDRCIIFYLSHTHSVGNRRPIRCLRNRSCVMCKNRRAHIRMDYYSYYVSSIIHWNSYLRIYFSQKKRLIKKPLTRFLFYVSFIASASSWGYSITQPSFSSLKQSGSNDLKMKSFQLSTIAGISFPLYSWFSAKITIYFFATSS